MSQKGRQIISKKILVPCIIAVLIGIFGIWQYYNRLPPSIGESQGPSQTTTEMGQEGSPKLDNESTDFAPNFSLKDINGSIFSLNQFNGRVIIVHFMATGCGGQIRIITDHQLGQLRKICDSLCGRSNFTMLTVVVSTCESNTLDLIRSFYNITWIFGNDYDDKKLDIIEAYEKYSIMDGTIVLINKAFNVAEVYTEEVTAENLTSTITRLLEA